MMKTKIHVSQKNISQNAQDGGSRPVLVLRDEHGIREASEIAILDKEGNVSARLRYYNGKPEPGGSRCWLETEGEIRIVS